MRAEIFWILGMMFIINFIGFFLIANHNGIFDSVEILVLLMMIIPLCLFMIITFFEKIEEPEGEK